MPFHRLPTLALFIASILFPRLGWAAELFPVRVVVITLFGEDTGDPKLQPWVARLPLDEKIAFPQGLRGLRYNREKQILGVAIGLGPTQAAASIMALGMDQRFDLSKAYWVLTRMAGVNPDESSIGSAAWAEWVVDFDLKHEIDRSEIPPDWTTGFVPFTKSTPFAMPRPSGEGGGPPVVYRLNSKLVDWAYGLTKGIKLDDTPALKAVRAGYPNRPNALKPPQVVKGDEIVSASWWIGDRLNKLAEEWMRYWTDGKGTFVMSSMEDCGFLQALTLLDKAKRADFQRVLVLRTGSDFTTPPNGQSAAEMLAEENSGGALSKLSALRPALEATYSVASPVVLEIASNWDRYETHIPGGP